MPADGEDVVGGAWGEGEGEGAGEAVDAGTEVLGVGAGAAEEEEFLCLHRALIEALFLTTAAGSRAARC